MPKITLKNLLNGENNLIILTKNLTINSGETLTVPLGKTLKISDGITLENLGIINNEGVINNKGTISNSDTIKNINLAEFISSEITGNKPISIQTISLDANNWKWLSIIVNVHGKKLSEVFLDSVPDNLYIKGKNNFSKYLSGNWSNDFTMEKGEGYKLYYDGLNSETISINITGYSLH